MADLGLKSFDKLYPMMIRKYKDLIVDQNANETDKINQIISKLNALGKLSNDVVRDWNTVYQWAMNDGLTTDVNNKVEAMKANGELDTVLQGVFLSLAGDLTTLHTTTKDTLVNSINEVDDLAKANQTKLGDLTTLQTADKDTIVHAINDNVVSLTQKVSKGEIFVNVKDYKCTDGQYVQGDGVHDDTTGIQNAINDAVANGGKVVFQQGKEYVVTSTIFVPVGITLDFNNATITPKTGGTFTNNFVFSLNSANVSTWDAQYPYKFVTILNLKSDNKNLLPSLKLIFAACPLRTHTIYSQRYYQTIASGNLYIDFFDIQYVKIVDHMSSTDFAISKSGQGDSIRFSHITNEKYLSNAYLKTLHVYGSLGCTIEKCLNGDFDINNCQATTFNNCHIEGQSITITDSTVTLNDCYLWKKPDTATITITDTLNASSGNINRPVVLNNVAFRIKYQFNSYGTDPGDIDISSYKGDLSLNNVFRECESYGDPLNYAYNTGINLNIGGGTFIKPDKNKCQINKQRIISDKIHSFSVDNGFFYLTGAINYNNANVTFQDTLTTYYYALAALYDTTRMIGIVSNGNEKSAVISSINSYAKISISSALPFRPMVRLYRGTATTSYNKYVDIPYPMSMGFLDTGVDVNGFPWISRTAGTYDTINTSYGFYYVGANIVSYGTGIPTVGTWTTGDKIINTNPTAGGYEGWLCTAGGSVGTWKGYGAIQA